VSAVNNGPLLTIALALFGEGSFLATWPQTFSSLKQSLSNEAARNSGPVCLYVLPLGNLLGELTDPYGEYPCISQFHFCMGDGSSPIRSWLQDLLDDPEGLANAFTAAAFLANQAWMLYSGASHSLYISYDMGADTVIPVISVAGVVIISILLFLYLLALLAMSVYASIHTRWTSRLDAFTMLRLGAAIGHDKVPLKAGQQTDMIEVLDEIPGRVEDAAGEQEEIGRLGLGALAMLDVGKRYECYKEDEENEIRKREERERMGLRR